MSDENTLSVNVSESIKTSDVGPGGKTPTPQEQEEKLPPEEVEKRQKIMLEYTRLSGRYVPPHNLKSRWVEIGDIEQVISDGKDLVAMCNIPRGKYSGISALAHSQINDKDPLRFFVLPNGMVVINAVIIDHTKAPLFKSEGCMSFADNDAKNMIPRYNKITVTYQTLAKTEGSDEPKLSNPATETLSGGQSHVFQHECSHMNGSNIYDADFDPAKAVGFGDGLPVDPTIWTKKAIEEDNKE